MVHDFQDRNRAAVAQLTEVFQITGRGVVIICAGVDGVIRIGQTASVGDLRCRVLGIEMPNPPQRSSGLAHSIGVLIDHPAKADLLPLVGQSVTFSSEGAH